MSVRLLRRRFTVDEYHRMAEAGILSEDDRVELIDGEIIETVAIGSRHAACVDRLTRLFSAGVGEQAIVRVQNPIRLSAHSEPEPDLALLRPRRDFYAAAHPSPQDVLLVVEVADTSANADREIKLPLYACAGILEVWLVNLEEQVVEVCRAPSSRGYQHVQHHGRGQSVAPRSLPDVVLAIDAMFG